MTCLARFAARIFLAFICNFFQHICRKQQKICVTLAFSPFTQMLPLVLFFQNFLFLNKSPFYSLLRHLISFESVAWNSSQSPLLLQSITSQSASAMFIPSSFLLPIPSSLSSNSLLSVQKLNTPLHACIAMGCHHVLPPRCLEYPIHCHTHLLNLPVFTILSSVTLFFLSFLPSAYVYILNSLIRHLLCYRYTCYW